MGGCWVGGWVLGGGLLVRYPPPRGTVALRAPSSKRGARTVAAVAHPPSGEVERACDSLNRLCADLGLLLESTCAHCHAYQQALRAITNGIACVCTAARQEVTTHGMDVALMRQTMAEDAQRRYARDASILDTNQMLLDARALDGHSGGRGEASRYPNDRTVYDRARACVVTMEAAINALDTAVPSTAATARSAAAAGRSARQPDHAAPNDVVDSDMSDASAYADDDSSDDRPT